MKTFSFFYTLSHAALSDSKLTTIVSVYMVVIAVERRSHDEEERNRKLKKTPKNKRKILKETSTVNLYCPCVQVTNRTRNTRNTRNNKKSEKKKKKIQ